MFAAYTPVVANEELTSYRKKHRNHPVSALRLYAMRGGDYEFFCVKESCSSACLASTIFVAPNC